MKICFLSSHFPPDFIGGGEWSTKYIAEGLADLGHDITVICGSNEDKKELLNGVKIERVAALRGLWAKPLLEQRKSKGLSLLLKEKLSTGFDVVHAHDFRTAQALALLELPNAVVTVRDFAPICGTTNNMWFDGRSCDGCTLKNVTTRCHRVCEASLARKPFRVWQYKYNLGFRNETYSKIKNQIYISEALRDRVATRLLIPKNTAVIPNPVGPEWLEPVKPVTGKKIVYAGTVEDYKGIRILIDAVAKFQKTQKDAELLIIGKGKIEQYKKYIADNCIDISIQFVGKKTQDEVRDCFDEAMVIVQPSVWEEPFGRTIIEAHARGRAVIASKIGGIKESFKEGTGYLVKPGDVDELFTALKNIINNSAGAQKMGEKGRSHVEENYTARKIANKYLEFYGNLR